LFENGKKAGHKQRKAGEETKMKMKMSKESPYFQTSKLLEIDNTLHNQSMRTYIQIKAKERERECEGNNMELEKIATVVLT
jgi:hypothetical protein